MKGRERIYSIFHNMKSRCYLPTFSRYEFYGAKGIKICDEWLKSFNEFYLWAINNGYNDKLEIDRINYNGNYEPANCRWVDKKLQNNNTRKNNYITYNGQTKTVAQWAEIYNLHRCVLNNRIRRGLSFEEAITKKTRNYKIYK